MNQHINPWFPSPIFLGSHSVAAGLIKWRCGGRAVGFGSALVPLGKSNNQLAHGAIVAPFRRSLQVAICPRRFCQLIVTLGENLFLEGTPCRTGGCMLSPNGNYIQVASVWPPFDFPWFSIRSLCVHLLPMLSIFFVCFPSSPYVVHLFCLFSIFSLCCPSFLFVFHLFPLLSILFVCFPSSPFVVHLFVCFPSFLFVFHFFLFVFHIFPLLSIFFFCFPYFPFVFHLFSLCCPSFPYLVFHLFRLFSIFFVCFPSYLFVFYFFPFVFLGLFPSFP